MSGSRPFLQDRSVKDKLWESRAVVSLARLRRNRGRRAEARDLSSLLFTTGSPRVRHAGPEGGEGALGRTRLSRTDRGDRDGLATEDSTNRRGDDAVHRRWARDHESRLAADDRQVVRRRLQIVGSAR